MLRIDIFFIDDHTIVSRATQPGIIILTLICLGVMRALFIKKATLVVDLGLYVSEE